jgi:hypothetical protein
MERYCSTGQSPQQAVAPTEEEDLEMHKNEIEMKSGANESYKKVHMYKTRHKCLEADDCLCVLEQKAVNRNSGHFQVLVTASLIKLRKWYETVFYFKDCQLNKY